MSWILLGIPVGIVLLYFGAEWVVSGAKKMALKLGIRPFVIGLTVVAMGSAAPEVVTTLASSSNPEIIIGSMVGSNIVNIGLAIGAAALITPILCKLSDIKFQAASMLAAVSIVAVLALTGSLGLIEGAILIVCLAIFVYCTYRIHKNTTKYCEKEAEAILQCLKTSKCKCIFMVVAGVLFLYFGARAFIEGAVDLAGMLEVSDLMIGLIVVAAGVSLPEICICIMAAYRKENELLVSNVIGSIVFNCFFALGAGVMYTTVHITHYTMVFHIPFMVLMAALLVIMVKTRNKIARWEGATLLCFYAGYIILMLAFPELTLDLI